MTMNPHTQAGLGTVLPFAGFAAAVVVAPRMWEYGFPEAFAAVAVLLGGSLALSGFLLNDAADRLESAEGT